MQYKVRILVSFSDFTILPQKLKQGQELVVSENVYKRLVSSGCKVQIIETIVPQAEQKSTKRDKA